MTPRASRNGVSYADGVLRVRTTAAPTDGQANEAVVGQVAKALRIAKSKITIKRGHSSRDKLLAVSGFDQAQLDAHLLRLKEEK